MASFIKQINFQGQLLEFSFIKIRTATNSKYFVMVDDSTREYHFSIENIDGVLKINDAPRVPQWIYDLEPSLLKAIMENDDAM